MSVRARLRLWRGGLAALAVLSILLLVVPLIMTIGASFSTRPVVTFPPRGFSFHWYGAVFTSSQWLHSIGLSLIVVVIVVPVALIISFPMAVFIGRTSFRGRGVLQLVMLSPILLPQVMVGLALLYWFQEIGLINTPIGIVLGHLVICVPYTLRVLIAGMSAIDPKLEQAAAGLGARRARIYWEIVLPQLKPAFYTAGVFAAVLSLGEVAVTLFIAGSNTTTLPVQIYSYVQYSFNPEPVAISAILLVVSFVLVLLSERIFKLSSAFRGAEPS